MDIRYEIIQWITKKIRRDELTKAVQISACAVSVRDQIRVSKLDRFSKLDSLKSTTQKGERVDIRYEIIQWITKKIRGDEDKQRFGVENLPNGIQMKIDCRIEQVNLSCF